MKVVQLRLKIFTIINSTEEKNVRVKFNSNLSFEKHANFLCQMDYTLALAIISHYMVLKPVTLFKKRLWHSCFPVNYKNTFFYWQTLGDCFCKINWIHERALTLVYLNNLSFSEILDLNNSVTMYNKNLKVLVTEIYKFKNEIAPEIIEDIFKL